MLWEMRHTAGGRCRRQVWRRKTSRGAEDASGGGRHIGRRKMHQKAEEASEAEAECEMERHGRRGFPLQAYLVHPAPSLCFPLVLAVFHRVDVFVTCCSRLATYRVVVGDDKVPFDGRDISVMMTNHGATYFYLTDY